MYFTLILLSLAALLGLEHDERTPDESIVLLHPNHTHDQHFDFIGKNFSELSEYKKWSYGYTMNFSDPALRDIFRGDPGVMLIETNRRAHLVDFVDKSPAGFEYGDMREKASESSDTTGRKSKRGFTTITEKDARYNLQMISATGKLETPVEKGGSYKYVDGFAGRGVNVYVFDLGIRVKHRAFTGRARNFGNLSPTDRSPYVKAVMDDRCGHGTHVAGIISASVYGVAPEANLINVKITKANGTGASREAIGRAILAVIEEHNANKIRKAEDPSFLFRGSIINLSLGWQGARNAVAEHIDQARKAGIQVFAAAGNDNTDASNTYPCSNAGVNCIAAVDRNYNKMLVSNYGPSVDFIAPGEKIQSLGINDGNVGLVVKSGTSMASAHATGVAAIFQSWLGIMDERRSAEDYV